MLAGAEATASAQPGQSGGKPFTAQIAQRIVVMQGGKVQQVDTPLVLYDAPANRFVAGFIGSPAMNLFSLGFPMAIIAGLTLIYLTLPNLSEAYLHLTRELLGNIGEILRSGRDV